MRLIDADSLIANMNKGIQGTARDFLKFYQMAVNDEPTAYDIEKTLVCNCTGCKHNKTDKHECMHCMRAYSDCYKSV